MTSINGVGSNSPIQRVVSHPVQKQVPVDAPAQVPLKDRVELSGVSNLVSALKTNNIRADLVAQMRGQIEAGTYDADGKKLDAAIERLMDDLL